MKNAFNNIGNPEIRAFARLVGGVVVLAFIAGIMVDADHPIAEILRLHNERFLHPYFGVVGLGFMGIGFVLAVACLCRYLQSRFLKRH